jgi:hypothetical protein
MTPRRALSASWNSTVPPMALQAGGLAGRAGQGKDARGEGRRQHGNYTIAASRAVADFHLQMPLAKHRQAGHLAVSSATCSPTPRNAAISSVDSSLQLQAGGHEAEEGGYTGRQLLNRVHELTGVYCRGCLQEHKPKHWQAGILQL